MTVELVLLLCIFILVVLGFIMDNRFVGWFIDLLLVAMIICISLALLFRFGGLKMRYKPSFKKPDLNVALSSYRKQIKRGVEKLRAKFDDGDEVNEYHIAMVKFYAIVDSHLYFEGVSDGYFADITNQFNDPCTSYEFKGVENLIML